MARGSKDKYTDKQKRKAEHIAEGYEERGVGEKEAKRRAWATVNKESGGGNKSGSGRGKTDTKVSSRKGGRKGGAASAARSPADDPGPPRRQPRRDAGTPQNNRPRSQARAKRLASNFFFTVDALLV